MQNIHRIEEAMLKVRSSMQEEGSYLKKKNKSVSYGGIGGTPYYGLVLLIIILLIRSDLPGLMGNIIHIVVTIPNETHIQSY